MPVAPLVGRAQHSAPRARCRGEERYAEAGRAATRAVAAHSAGNLPRARPPLAVSKKGSAGQLRAEATPHLRSPLSRLCHHSPDHRHRLGEVVWSHLCPGISEERPDGVRGSGRQCLGNSGLHRCRINLRDPLARTVQPLNGVCLNSTSATMPWWKSTAQTEEMWPRAWYARATKPPPSKGSRSRLPESTPSCPTARSPCFRPQSLPFAGAAWSSLALAWAPKRQLFAANRKSYSAWAPKSAF